MIREIVKPKNSNLVINIPDEYIGQEVEYIVFPLHPTSPQKALHPPAYRSLLKNLGTTNHNLPKI